MHAYDIRFSVQYGRLVIGETKINEEENAKKSTSVQGKTKHSDGQKIRTS